MMFLATNRGVFKRFSKVTSWFAGTLLVMLALGCGGPNLDERATIAQNGVSQRALVAGNTYISTGADGERTTKEWIEGRVVNMSGWYQIVQPRGYEGPPVLVDDGYKATMPVCNAPAGSTWTRANGESGVHAAGDIAVFVDGEACVYRARAESDTSTAGPAASPSATASPEPTPEPTSVPTAVPTAVQKIEGFEQLEPLQHVTSVSNVFFSLPAPVEVDEEEFEALGYSNFHYEYTDGNQRILVTIADIGGFFSKAEEQEFKDNIATRSKTGAENGADLLPVFGTVRDLERTGEGRAVTAETETGDHPGYEVDVAAGNQVGHVRYFRRDGVKLTLVGLGVNERQWEQIVESIRFESTVVGDEVRPTIELTAEEQAEHDAALERVIELVGDRKFLDGPYVERELAPLTGGWNYVDAPPFGAADPGEDAELDLLWVGCREGDGFACDTLTLDAEVNSSYQRFGLTCGGRSASRDCSDLLGSDPHPGFARSYNDTDDFYRNRVGGYRLDRIPGPDSAPPGGDPVRDLLWAQCGIEASASACWKMSKDLVSSPDIYEAFGLSCGGRRVFASMDCFSMMRDDADKVPAGSEAPGTYGAEADELWAECDRDATRCFSFIVLSLGVDDDRREDFSLYNTFGNSCGGEYDRPLTELTLRGGCRVPYREMATIADTSQLLAPPTGTLG